MNIPKDIDRQRLCVEVELVEKILEAASDPVTLNQASELSLKLLQQTQKTNIFDAVDISEYVAYRFDIERHKREGDIEKMENSMEGVKPFLEQTLSDLQIAKDILDNK